MELKVVALPVSAELEEDVSENPDEQEEKESWLCIFVHLW